MKRTDFAHLINQMGLKRGLEIGVDQGLYAEHLLENSKLELLVGVDAWVLRHSGKHRPEAEDRLAKFGNRHKMVNMLSHDAVKMFDDGYFDFVYIDGNHKYNAVRQDLADWWPKCRSGGIFSGHDYVKMRMCQVMPAVDLFFKDRAVFLLTDEPLPSWWVVKP